MYKFTTTNPNKSIYIIEPNTYKQWFGAAKVLYCHKLKFFYIFFRQKNISICNDITKIITRTNF